MAISGGAALAQSQLATNGAVSEHSKVADESYTEAYEKAYRTAFKVRSVNQCVATASEAAAAGYDMTPTCVCMTDALLATNTVQQLEQLASSDKDNAKIKEVATQCLRSNPPWPVGNAGQSASSPK
jgi:hypothetical protein